MLGRIGTGTGVGGMPRYLIRLQSFDLWLNRALHSIYNYSLIPVRATPSPQCSSVNTIVLIPSDKSRRRRRPACRRRPSCGRQVTTAALFAQGTCHSTHLCSLQGVGHPLQAQARQKTQERCPPGGCWRLGERITRGPPCNHRANIRNPISGRSQGSSDTK